MDNGHDVKSIIREFIKENFLYALKPSELTDDTSFTDTGIIDSTGVLELIDFIEERFKISIENGDVVPENLDTLNRIDRYIRSKTQ